MKSIKLVLLSLFITLGLFWTVTYTSCTKDACKAVTCLNGGTCSGGVCGNCPKGVGGLNCEIIYRQLYANTYLGSGIDDSGKAYLNNTLTFSAGADTNYTQMHLVWTNPGVRTVSMPVTLTNNSSTGSNFTLGTATVGTYSYSGTGSINNTVASVTLSETDSGKHPVLITLLNFNKQ